MERTTICIQWERKNELAHRGDVVGFLVGETDTHMVVSCSVTDDGTSHAPLYVPKECIVDYEVMTYCRRPETTEMWEPESLEASKGRICKETP